MKRLSWEMGMVFPGSWNGADSRRGKTSREPGANLASSGSCSLDGLPGSYHLNPQARAVFHPIARTIARFDRITMRAWTILSLETWSRMPRYTIRTDAARDPESLEDLVYRPRLATDNRHVRSANPLIALPLTLLGYLALGLLGWQVVRYSKSAFLEPPKAVAVDLLDASEGDAPQVNVPAPLPSGGGPPPGAMEKADAPPPPLAANPDAVPEKPPTELPTQDLSGTAFPAQAPGGSSSNGSGTGLGSDEGTGPSSGGHGAGVRTVYREYEALKIKFTPPKPPYPLYARQAGIQGTVRVEVTIGTDGVPIAAQATEGPPILRKTAEAQAMKYRYEPASENGEPIIEITIFTMRFTIAGP
jgi:periplasmic protein TonB